MSASIMRNRAFYEDKQKDKAGADRALIASPIDVGDRFNLRRPQTWTMVCVDALSFEPEPGSGI